MTKLKLKRNTSNMMDRTGEEVNESTTKAPRVGHLDFQHHLLPDYFCAALGYHDGWLRVAALWPHTPPGIRASMV